ncbi:MAG: HEPN domain-containing protein [Candidatus Nanopusillus sp.]|jgi:HEPN domain-containing protein|nr:HEPN domain-containing protein [Candidatus Nanopusillus sp.]
MDFLKNNSIDFFKEGERNLNERKYNLAMFHLEQALQLGLKYKLYELTGTYDKTHDIIILLNKVIELTKDNKLKEIMDMEYITLELIKQAYISSRYLPFTYDKKSVEKAYQVVKKILNVLGIL